MYVSACDFVYRYVFCVCPFEFLKFVHGFNYFNLEITLKLAGSYSPMSGRVEITINNITGTICDDFWDDADATVICRMLGYG